MSRRALLRSAGAAVAGAAVVGCLPRLAVARDNPTGAGAQGAEIAGEKPLWQWFTVRARNVILFAGEEARRLGHRAIEPEHLLLGLMREDNLGSGTLLRLRVSPVALRTAIEQRGAPGQEVVEGGVAMAPRGKRVVDLAYAEAVALRNNYLGCEHLLLGLLAEGEGLAAKVLAEQGVTLEAVHREMPIVGEKWVQVLEAEERLHDSDTPENRRRFQEALAAYHAFIRQTPRL